MSSWNTGDSDQAALVTTDGIIGKQREAVGWHENGVNQAIKALFLSPEAAAASGYSASGSICPDLTFVRKSF